MSRTVRIEIRDADGRTVATATGQLRRLSLWRGRWTRFGEYTAETTDLTADDLVTAITQAPDEASAMAVLADVPRTLLDEVADLVYIDPVGRSSAVVRRAIIREARS